VSAGVQNETGLEGELSEKYRANDFVICVNAGVRSARPDGDPTGRGQLAGQQFLGRGIISNPLIG